MSELCGLISRETRGRVGNLDGLPVIEKVHPTRSKRRTYTARDAGRVICYAVGAGATSAQIKQAAGCCLGDLCDLERALIRRLLVIGAVVLVAVTVAIPWLRVLSRIIALPVVGELAARFLPEEAAALLLEESRVIELAAGEFRVILTEAESALSSINPIP